MKTCFDCGSQLDTDGDCTGIVCRTLNLEDASQVEERAAAIRDMRTDEPELLNPFYVVSHSGSDPYWYL